MRSKFPQTRPLVSARISMLGAAATFAVTACSSDSTQPDAVVADGGVAAGSVVDAGVVAHSGRAQTGVASGATGSDEVVGTVTVKRSARGGTARSSSPNCRKAGDSCGETQTVVARCRA